MKQAFARVHRGGMIATGCAVLSASLGLVACGSSEDGKIKPGTRQLAVKLTDKGCSPAKATVPAGPLRISVTNGGSTAVTEMELKDASGVVVGERENVVDGVSSSFSLDVKPGKYLMNCPNGDREDNGVLLVTGRPAGTATATAP